ncbi:hypothetical protein COL26b_008715 [Colletotrichum chrysophilum]|uniref:uncharacterized protein n=1 Tax=Colletotrichum chrysophilum TaxID=1836956 RepID=UPI002300CB28|nr:uncharacterized protein COL26b_008715 [Colletotrichum chrysophilum]KAJ0373096.1 hypothetical protein COL26b_008715 [Colletotrichum chrysophilum]
MDHSTSTAEIVSAQLITATLSGLAYNSMTQPSGLICEADADVGFPLRISPVICIIDAINIMGHFAWYCCTKGSLYEVMKALLGWRFKGQHHAELRDASPTGSPKRILKTVVSKILPRIITSSPPICTFIKICGSEGLVWTKVIAVAFVFSFIVSELLVVWPAMIWPEMIISIAEPNKNPQSNEDPQPNENPQPDNDEHSPYLVTYSSIALAVMFMLWFASAAAQDCWGQPHHIQPQWLAKTTGMLGCPLAVSALLYLYYGNIADIKNRLESTQSITAIIAATWCAIAMWFAAETLEALRRVAANSHARETVEMFTAWYFFCLNFATALIYYMYSYNPAGTAKPHWDWEEWLG